MPPDPSLCHPAPGHGCSSRVSPHPPLFARTAPPCQNSTTFGPMEFGGGFLRLALKLKGWYFKDAEAVLPPRDALEGKGPERRPEKRLGRRLEGVAKAVGGGYCRVQLPLKRARAVRDTVAGHRLGAPEGGGYPIATRSLLEVAIGGSRTHEHIYDATVSAAVFSPHTNDALVRAREGIVSVKFSASTVVLDGGGGVPTHRTGRLD